MRIEHVSSGPFTEKKSAKRICFTKAFLLSGMMLAATPFLSTAQIAPPSAYFGPNQTRTVCSGLTTDVSDWLKVNDPTVVPATETITWTIAIHPSNGILTGDGTTASSGGSASIPVGMTYTPDPGYIGNDNFTVIVDDGNGGTVPISVFITINAGPSVSLGAIQPVCSGVNMATLPFSNMMNVGPDTVDFVYNGASQSWTVPEFVTNLKFDLMGASGGHDSYLGTGVPGMGGRVQGTMAVSPGTQLNVFVGGVGNDGVIAPGTAAGGFNGGGSASFHFYGSGGAGGGATDIRVGGAALANRKAVAGGGGGNGAELTTVYPGGNGGGLVGGVSVPNVSGSSAKGGTQALGGAPAAYPFWTSGSFGTSGWGGAGSTQGISGGGGGGYYGGGGGIWNGGGGGSSYTDPFTVSAVTHTQGAHNGDGMATVYYTIPGTYSIIWDGAPGNGFENQAGEALPTSGDITFPVPPTATPGTYHGVVTVNNGNCDSPPYDVYITIKPKPVVDHPGNFPVCEGSMTPDVNFTGTALAPSDYHWMTTDLSMSGSGHIPSYMPVNTTNMPITTNFLVYPFVNGCYGDTAYFNVISNPMPELNSTLTPASVCNNTTFGYIPTSLVPGTTFDWSRDVAVGIDNPPAGGVNSPGEILTNSTNDPVAVAYVYTLTANTCENVQTVNVNVNPTPVLTSSLNPTALCNDEPFVYAPTSSAPSAVLSWSRASVVGISNAGAAGLGNINEPLHNTTTAPVAVTYVVTMAIDACNYNQNVVVSVNPPLSLTSATALMAVCDSIITTYTPSVSVPTAEVTWSRMAVAGLNNPAATGINGFSETLVNNTTGYVDATYEYMMKAFGCVRMQNVTVPVKPRPRLTSTLTPNGICTNMYFDYTATSGVTGTTFIWARDVKPGISNGAMMSAGNVHEVLVNVTDLPITVPYIYTGTANGCNHQDTVKVVVNPLPKISNDVSSLAVCDSALFTFSPNSVTPGTSYSWSRAYEAGISNLSATGTGNPNERLNNTTYITVPATYVYTITAAGCNNTQNVTVQVRPSAILTKTTAVVCSGAPFTFDPVSYTSGTSFDWSRAAVTGITPATASGEGSVEDVLTSNSNTAPIVVVYDYELTIAGCTNTQKLTVSVNPAPSTVIATTVPANLNLCNNSMYQNFGAGTPAPAGFAYSWSVSNAILNSVGNNGQYAVVSFTTPGKATVTLITHNSSTGCTSKTNTDVNVNTGSAIIPEVIYFNNQFICKSNVSLTYQWGYDDASTLDSVVIAGETNQNYTNAFPDFTNKYYWVITNNGGCVQKTYFNKPTGITNVDAVVASLKLYPNPARDIVNVEVSAFVTGDISMEVFNMLGQKVQNAQAVNNKAQISIADLAAGAYIVDCYSDGVKIAAARFIKN